LTNITRREHDEVIKEDRSKSAPGNNGIGYLVHKRCPKIFGNLWAINRVAFENGYNIIQTTVAVGFLKGFISPKQIGILVLPPTILYIIHID
jgi:hypothetical protein